MKSHEDFCESIGEFIAYLIKEGIQLGTDIKPIGGLERQR